MKVTSYILSKKLAEAGFEAETNFIWAWSGDDHQLFCMPNIRAERQDEKDFLAYDLETILEALPKQHDFFTRGVGKYELRIWYHEDKAFIGYQNFDGFDKLLTLEQEENESLADTAARLLLTLVEKGLLTFKK